MDCCAKFLRACFDEFAASECELVDERACALFYAETFQKGCDEQVQKTIPVQMSDAAKEEAIKKQLVRSTVRELTDSYGKVDELSSAIESARSQGKGTKDAIVAAVLEHSMKNWKAEQGAANKAWEQFLDTFFEFESGVEAKPTQSARRRRRAPLRGR